MRKPGPTDLVSVRKPGSRNGYGRITYGLYELTKDDSGLELVPPGEPEETPDYDANDDVDAMAVTTDVTSDGDEATATRDLSGGTSDVASTGDAASVTTSGSSTGTTASPSMSKSTTTGRASGGQE